jgi:hypothetical protein
MAEANDVSGGGAGDTSACGEEVWHEALICNGSAEAAMIRPLTFSVAVTLLLLSGESLDVRAAEKEQA